MRLHAIAHGRIGRGAAAASVARHGAALALALLLGAIAVLAPAPARGDAAGEQAAAAARGTASSTGILRWAADASSGAPYVFQDPDDPEHLIGFEVDVVTALAAELGLRPEFVQNEWGGLIPGLDRGQYDVAINGIEITPDRAEVVAFSTPYYATFEQLAVRRGARGPRTLDECRGHAVGTLKSSVASRLLDELGGVAIRDYEDEVNAYDDLRNGRLDAVLLDYPIALYYAAPDPALELVGPPIGRLLYGIALRRDDTALRARVDAALQALIRNGRLGEILARWNLWTPLAEDQLGTAPPTDVRPVAYTAFLDQLRRERSWWQRIARYELFLPLFLAGAARTLQISVLAMLLAVSAGLAIAVVRLYGPRPLAALATLGVEAVRGTPLLIQLFFIFYALPSVGIRLSPLAAAILGLGFNYAAYESENYRAGIAGVPRGQMEAALALGMSRTQALRHVVLPQAVRLVIPPITNDFISLLKDSSLVSIITMVELTKVYTQISSTTYDYFGTGILVAILYLLLGLPFVALARWTERRLASGQPSAATAPQRRA